MTSTTLSETKFVAYCDILGFSNAVLNHFDETIELYNFFIERLKNNSTEGMFKDVSISVYSDSIVIVADNLPPLLNAVKHLWFSSLTFGWLIRGGVAYGRYWERKEDGSVYVVSDALVRAVGIEKSIGVPAVAFSPEVNLSENLWVVRYEHDIFYAPLLHFQDLNFVNPFNPYLFNTAIIRVTELWKKHPEHSEKYKWFLEVAEAVHQNDVLIPQSILDSLINQGVLIPKV